MKLSDFILDNIEQILQDWENFAKTIFPKNQQTSTRELRDHAKQMLLVIVSELEHFNPSKVNAIDASNKNLVPQDTPAEEHGINRLEQGFTITEIALEYQALRKSVMSLFGEKSDQIQPIILNELVQFNESLDEALSEAICSYSFAKEKQTLLFNTMLSSSPDLNYTLDLNGSFIYINKAMEKIFQKPAHEILGKATYNFAMPSAADIREHIQYILKTKKECHGEIHLKKSGKTPEYFFKYVYAPVFDINQNIVAIAGTSRDITKQKEAEAKIWHHANYDHLTGLANRRRFHDKLEEAIKHSQRTNTAFALFFIDLDKFKEINDKLGHDGGDNFLKKIATRLRSCVRETDVLSRVGGDEFTIILNDHQEEPLKNTEHHTQQAIMIAKKILSTIKRTIQIKKTHVHLTASIGIALFPTDSDVSDQLLRMADEAMYCVKKNGGNGYGFHDKITRLKFNPSDE